MNEAEKGCAGLNTAEHASPEFSKDLSNSIGYGEASKELRDLDLVKQCRQAEELPLPLVLKSVDPNARITGSTEKKG